MNQAPQVDRRLPHLMPDLQQIRPMAIRYALHDAELTIWCDNARAIAQAFNQVNDQGQPIAPSILHREQVHLPQKSANMLRLQAPNQH